MVSPERFDQEAAASTRVSPESCGLPSVISWTLIENNSHSTAKTVHTVYHVMANHFVALHVSFYKK